MLCEPAEEPLDTEPMPLLPPWSCSFTRANAGVRHLMGGPPRLPDACDRASDTGASLARRRGEADRPGEQPNPCTLVTRSLLGGRGWWWVAICAACVMHGSCSNSLIHLPCLIPLHPNSSGLAGEDIGWAIMRNISWTIGAHHQIHRNSSSHQQRPLV